MTSRAALVKPGPLFATIAAFGILAATMASGLAWRHFGDDGGELILASVFLGVAHPAGCPAYLFLGKMFSLLPGTAMAWKFNLSLGLRGQLGRRRSHRPARLSEHPVSLEPRSVGENRDRPAHRPQSGPLVAVRDHRGVSPRDGLRPVGPGGSVLLGRASSQRRHRSGGADGGGRLFRTGGGHPPADPVSASWPARAGHGCRPLVLATAVVLGRSLKLLTKEIRDGFPDVGRFISMFLSTVIYDHLRCKPGKSQVRGFLSFLGVLC